MKARDTRRALPRVLAVSLACWTALAACGCSLRLHEPGPHLAPDWHHESWRVHCESASTHAPSEDAAPGVHHARWVWARDEQAREILLAGELEDGFLVVRGTKTDTGAVDPDASVTLPWLRDRCLRTLEQDQPDEVLELGRVTAARHGEHFEATILLPDETASTARVRRLVVFGDSLSDTGLLKRRLRLMPDAPYWMGRFSNGPIWIDYLEALTTLAVQNHAHGGAAVTWHDHLPGETLIDEIKASGQFFVTGSTGHQVDDYLTRVLRDGRVTQPRETVFMIWAGANDYISKEPISGAITTFLNSPEGEAGYRAVTDEVMAALERQVGKLVAAGASRIVLGGLPDLGETPIVLQNDTYLPPGPVEDDEARRLELSRRLTRLAIDHNERLHTLVEKLRRELSPVEILTFHTSDLFGRTLEDNLVNSLQRIEGMGFVLEPQQRLLDDAGERRVLFDRCYLGSYLGSDDPSEVCSNEARAVFWDVVHPTTYSHCWQAWSFSRTLAGAGWIAGPHDADTQAQWCGRVAKRTLGSARSEWTLSPE